MALMESPNWGLRRSFCDCFALKGLLEFYRPKLLDGTTSSWFALGSAPFLLFYGVGINTLCYYPTVLDILFNGDEGWFYPFWDGLCTKMFCAFTGELLLAPITSSVFGEVDWPIVGWLLLKLPIAVLTTMPPSFVLWRTPNTFWLPPDGYPCPVLLALFTGAGSQLEALRS